MSHELYEGHLKRKRYTFQLFVSNIEGHELRTMTQKYVRQGENIHSQCEAFPWTWYDYRRRLRSASKIFGFPQNALSFQCHFTFLGWRKVMKDRGEYTRKEKGIDRIVYQWIREEQVCCDFDRASSLICGNKLPTRCNRGSYCRSYCLLNMFRASLCPSSGAQKYYTVVAACGISCCGFQVVGLVWSWAATWKTTARNTTGRNHCIILLSSWWWA